MPQTLFDKIWNTHLVADTGTGSSLIAIDRVFLHERTGSVALKGLAEEGTVPMSQVAEAIRKYGIDADKINPLYA